MKFNLEAGETSTLQIVGRHFRLFSAETESIQATFYSASGAVYYAGELKTAVGLDFSDRNDFPEPFARVELVSDTAQTLDIWASPVKADDDRLSGNFDINAALSVAQTAPANAETKPVQTISTTTEVLPVRAGRKTALIQVSSDVIVDDAINGVTVSGSFGWDNQTALNLTPVSGSVDVRILEEY
ncbi:hypothetical protein LG288_05920 [Idiomarina seosinensis]|uniref:hypothetical protein n=1 Tax=Idiomarina seosinensis TaxID=281739 RepID=UPI003850CC68